MAIIPERQNPEQQPYNHDDPARKDACVYVALARMARDQGDDSTATKFAQRARQSLYYSVALHPETHRLHQEVLVLREIAQLAADFEQQHPRLSRIIPVSAVARVSRKMINDRTNQYMPPIITKLGGEIREILDGNQIGLNEFPRTDIKTIDL